MKDHPAFKLQENPDKMKELDVLVGKVEDTLKETMGVECQVVVCVHARHEGEQCKGVILLSDQDPDTIASIMEQGFYTAFRMAEDMKPPPKGTTVQ